MIFRKNKPKLELDPLIKAKSRQEVITRLEDMGYYVRPKKIRRPKIGDTIRYWVGGGWSINTQYHQTATVTGFDEYGRVQYEKRNKAGGLIASGTATPLNIVKVSKPRTKANKGE